MNYSPEKSIFIDNESSALMKKETRIEMEKSSFNENKKIVIDTRIPNNPFDEDETIVEGETNDKEMLIERKGYDLRRSINFKTLQKIIILIIMAAILFLALFLFTYYSYERGSGKFLVKDNKYGLNIDIRNCKILINENTNSNDNSILWKYEINYLLNYISQQSPIIEKDESRAFFTLKSQRLLWRTCLLTFSIPKELILTELNIHCQNECILVSNHASIAILGGSWESSYRFDINMRNLNIKDSLFFNASYGTFQLNEFKIESGQASINLGIGEVILQSSSDINVNWTNPSFAYCFAGPFVNEENKHNCTSVSFRNDSKNSTVNRTGVCSGLASICREETCKTASKVEIIQLSGNTYVNLLPETGVDVTYNPSLQVASGFPYNNSVEIEDNFEKEIRKSYNSSIKDKDPILIVNLGNRHLQQQSYEKWVISSNPSFAYLRPWWLAVFSLDLLTSKTLDFTGTMSPGICPYHFSGSLKDYAQVQKSLIDYFNLEHAEISFVQPMNTDSPSLNYKNGTGIVEFYNDKPVSETWLKVIQNTEGTYSLFPIDIHTQQFILPTLILSFIGAALIGGIITRVFMVGVVMAQKKIKKSAEHAQYYKDNKVDLRVSEEEKVNKDLEELDPSPEQTRINIGNILSESSFRVFMKTVPRISAFFGFYSYSLIKTYVLNSVEDFCNVIFQKQGKTDFENLRKILGNEKKFEMKEIKLKSCYEKFCFLNHYPELSLSDNVRLFNSYGFDLVPDKEVIALSYLVEKKRVELIPPENFQQQSDSEIIDFFFKNLYEKSTIESDIIYMDEIKTNCELYCKKQNLLKRFEFDIEDFIYRNKLNIVYKEGVKLVYNEKLERRDPWYIIILVCIANLFLSLLSVFKITDFKLSTRKQTFYTIDEDTLEEQFNILSDKGMINLNPDSVKSSYEKLIREKAIKKTLFYPWNWFHDFFYILLHFIMTGLLIFPFFFLAFLYEINYEPYSTVSQKELISLKDLLLTPMELPYRIFDFIAWNIVIIFLMIIFSSINVLDDLVYIFNSTFPEDKKFLEFQREMDLDFGKFSNKDSNEDVNKKNQKPSVNDNQSSAKASGCCSIFFSSLKSACLRFTKYFKCCTAENCCKCATPNLCKCGSQTWCKSGCQNWCKSGCLNWCKCGSQNCYKCTSPRWCKCVSAKANCFEGTALSKCANTIIDCFAQTYKIVLSCFNSYYYKIIRKRMINFYWIYVFFMIFCYSSYVGLVLLWLLLGAIINPNNFLVYATASLTFLTFVSTKYYQFNSLTEQGFKGVKEIVEKYLREKVKGITFILSQELGKAMVGLKNISEVQVISDFAANKAKELGLENEFNEIKSFSDNPDKILESAFQNLEVAIVDPAELKKRMLEKKEILFKKAEIAFKNQCKVYQIPDDIIEMMININLRQNREEVTNKIANLLEGLLIKKFNLEGKFPENLLKSLLALISTHKTPENRQEIYFELLQTLVTNLVKHFFKTQISESDRVNIEKLISLIINQGRSKNEIILEIIPVTLNLIKIKKIPPLLTTFLDKYLPLLINGSEKNLQKIVIKFISDLPIGEPAKKMFLFLASIDKTNIKEDLLGLEIVSVDTVRDFFTSLSLNIDESIASWFATVCLILKDKYLNTETNTQLTDMINGMLKNIGLPNELFPLVTLSFNIGKEIIKSRNAAKLKKIPLDDNCFGELACLFTQNLWKLFYNDRTKILKQNSHLIRAMATKIGISHSILLYILEISWGQASEEKKFVEANAEINYKTLACFIIKDNNLSNFQKKTKLSQECQKFCSIHHFNEDFFKSFIYFINNIEAQESFSKFLTNVPEIYDQSITEERINLMLEQDQMWASKSYEDIVFLFNDKIIPNIETSELLKRKSIITESVDLPWVTISNSFDEFFNAKDQTNSQKLEKEIKKLFALFMNWTKETDYLRKDKEFLMFIKDLGISEGAIDRILNTKYYFIDDPKPFIYKFFTSDREIASAVLSILYLEPDYRLITQYLKIPKYQIQSMISFLHLLTISEGLAQDAENLDAIMSYESVNLWCTKLGIVKQELSSLLRIYFNLLRETDIEQIISDLKLGSGIRVDKFKSIINLFSYKMLPDLLKENEIDKEITILRKKILLLKSLNKDEKEESPEKLLYDIEYSSGHFHDLRTLFHYCRGPKADKLNFKDSSNIFFYVLGLSICRDMSEIDPAFILKEFVLADTLELKRNSFKSILFWFFKNYTIHPSILLYFLGHTPTIDYLHSILSINDRKELENISWDNIKYSENLSKIFVDLFDDQYEEYSNVRKIIWLREVTIIQNLEIINLIKQARLKTYSTLTDEPHRRLILKLIDIKGSRENYDVFEKEFLDFEKVAVSSERSKIRSSIDKKPIQQNYNSNNDNDRLIKLEKLIDMYTKKHSEGGQPVRDILKMFLLPKVFDNTTEFLEIFSPKLQSKIHSFNLIFSAFAKKGKEFKMKQFNELLSTLDLKSPLFGLIEKILRRKFSYEINQDLSFINSTLDLGLEYLLKNTFLDKNQKQTIIRLIKLYMRESFSDNEILSLTQGTKGHENEMIKKIYRYINNQPPKANVAVETQRTYSHTNLKFLEDELGTYSLFSLLNRDVRARSLEKKILLPEDIEYLVMKAIIEKDALLKALVARLEKKMSISLEELIKHFQSKKGQETEYSMVYSKFFKGETVIPQESIDNWNSLLLENPRIFIKYAKINRNTAFKSLYAWLRLPDLTKLYSSSYFTAPKHRKIITKYLMRPLLILFEQLKIPVKIDTSYDKFTEEVDFFEMVDNYCLQNTAPEINPIGFLKNFAKAIATDLEFFKVDINNIKTWGSGILMKFKEKNSKLYAFIHVLSNLINSQLSWDSELETIMEIILGKAELVQQKETLIIITKLIPYLMKLNINSLTGDLKTNAIAFLVLILDIIKVPGGGNSIDSEKNMPGERNISIDNKSSSYEAVLTKLKILIENPIFPYNNFKQYHELIENIFSLVKKPRESANNKYIIQWDVEENEEKIAPNDKAVMNEKMVAGIKQFSTGKSSAYLRNDMSEASKKSNQNQIVPPINPSFDNVVVANDQDIFNILITVCEESFKVIEFMKDQEKSSNKEERRLVINNFVGVIIDNFIMGLNSKETPILDDINKKKLKVIFKSINFLIKAEFENLTPDILIVFDLDPSKFTKIQEILIAFREIIKGPQQFVDSKLGSISEKIVGTNLSSVQSIMRKVGGNEDLTFPDLFKLVDKDRSGNISLQEFKILTRRLGIVLTDHRIKEIFTSVKLKTGTDSTTNTLTLDEKEFEHSITYLQNKSILLALEALGLSREFLTGLLIFLIFILLVIFAFIFIGVEAFAIAGTFGAIINSIFPIVGGAVLNRRNNRYADILTSEEFKSIVDKCIKIVQSMKI